MVGDTGCGKSTLSNALKHGSDSLEINEAKQAVLISEGNKDTFKIGHEANSCTGPPTAIKIGENHFLVDTAGFNDSDTKKDYVNFTGVRQVINNVDSFEIVLLLKHSGLTANRGGAGLLKSLFKIYQLINVDDIEDNSFKKVLIPVLT